MPRACGCEICRCGAKIFFKGLGVRSGGLPGRAAHRSIVLFDGICNLCNASVRTIAANDPRGRFQFASLESDTAKEVALRFGRTPAELNSIVLVDASGWHERSDAALRIACELRFPWPLLGLAFAVPTPLRDRVYDWVARNRYRWFGTK